MKPLIWLIACAFIAGAVSHHLDQNLSQLSTYMISQQPSLTPETNDNLLSDAASSAAIDLSPLAVLLAAALLVVNAAISLKFALGWHKSLAVACIR